MRKIFFVKLLFLIIVFGCGLARAQTNEFTYQGSLKNGGNPANGNYDFQFALFDVSGNQLGSTITLNNVAVNNGVFSVLLNFGDQFSGPLRYLEIRVRQSGSSTFTTLSPRQLISNSPYSVKSLVADVAAVSVNSSQLGGIGAGGFIQNTTSQQSSSNFNISGNGIIGGNLGLGTAPSFRLDAVGRIRLRQLPGDVTGNNTAGLWLFQNTPNTDRAFIGMQNDDYVGFYGTVGGWGLVMNTQNGNVGIGTTNPNSPLHINGNSGNFALTFTNSANTSGRRGYRLAFDNDRLTFQRADDSGNFAENQVSIVQATGNVGIGTTSPSDKLVVNGFGVVRTRINSDSQPQLTFSINNQPQWSLLSVFGAVGGNYLVIKNETNGIDALQITPDNAINIAHFANGGDTITCNYRGILAYCSSSLRYKTNIAPFGSGLNLVKQLAPISFNWKESGKKDFGLGAEDVEKIEPLLVTYNDNGEVEGVKYERIGVVLINAVKEQQTQIEQQQKQLDEQNRGIKLQKEKLEAAEKQLGQQKTELEALKVLVCSQNPTAELCKPKN